MGVKADSPKLTPAERLARKRAAARLRQQRCRARKRQAMLEKKREEVASRQRCAKLAHEPPRPQVVMRAIQHPPRSLFPVYKPVHLMEGKPWIRGQGPARPQMIKSTSEPIYNCVSFDSTKSMEESREKISRATASPPRSPTQKTPTVVTPTNQLPSPGKPVTRTVSSEKVEESEGPLLSEEEAAVAAMLSLKSGSTSPSADKSEKETKEPPLLPSQSPPREVVIKNTIPSSTGPGGMKPELMKPKNGVRGLPPRRMVPRLHDYEAYAYAHPMKFPPHSRRAPLPPAYYRVHASVPPPPPHPHYARYHYPPAPRFVTYEYE
eukprot:CAMPEP_0116114032 /NCGR_PEP_ID=MMETSP0327-20121206/19811_1 /TAXON_ID=44447 /ORGANISM="Pseudo-nitzschia delicatissima, Strain B596" /LENGTH=320 /DNA_ID=CAMNT_0003607401 /DNA_START=115 /DNA_END=1077 /DNA_ORIENTATION=+